MNAAKLQSIPLAFRAYRQFINWIPVRNSKGKFDKIPVNPAGEDINAHDPANHVDAETACASGYEVGFVFTENDPFFFVDVDSAWNGAEWSQLATWVATQFPGAAMERSHSGTGLHVFGSGSSVLHPSHGTRRNGLPLEIYTHSRFVALTGDLAAGDASLDFSAVLPAVVTACSLPLEQTTVDLSEADPRDLTYTGPEDDDELVHAMCRSKSSFGQMFGGKATAKQLWERDVEALGRAFPAQGRADGLPFDHSSADAALMFYLSFWTGRDWPRMVRLFERSALYRPHHYSDRYAYRLARVLRVGARNPKVYDKPRDVPQPGPIDPPAGMGLPAPETTHDGLLTSTAQVEHFKGCVYVQDAHAVMMPDGRMLRPAQFDAVKGGHKFQMQHDNARPTLSAFECFTQSRMRRFAKAKGTCFRPTLPPGKVTLDDLVNTWVPPVIEEAQGDVTPFLRHLALLLPDERDRRILLTYMKAVVQYPGVKFQWAPILQGTPGNGKSLFIRVLRYAVGTKYSHLPKASQLTEKFNSWIEGNVFIGVEEIKISEKRREILDDLKDAVTNDVLEIRGMMREKRMGDNVTNWMFCTNHKDAVPIDRNERRYAPFFTAQQSVDDLERDGMGEKSGYFPELYEWLKSDGYAAVSWFLRHTPIDPEFNPAGKCHRAPSTSSMAEAIEEGMGTIEQEIMEAINTGRQGFRDGWISGAALDKWLDERGSRKVGPNKKAGILNSLGYEKKFRSPILIFEESMAQPIIYRKIGVAGEFKEFLIAQGYNRSLVL